MTKIQKQLAELRRINNILFTAKDSIEIELDAAIIKTEQARVELSKLCPHETILYGEYNQCEDCEEWF